MSDRPLVSVIIPHLHGKDILHNCLCSLEKTTYENKEVILVDNGCTDGSVRSAKERFPWLRIVKNARNLGYAGGCNAGLQKANGRYVLFLNNDTEGEAEWLSELVALCERDERIAACQPKILRLQDQTVFDYSGAAGGELDIFGYPFARGRLFFTLEKDEHQYEEGGDIFWASGTAIFIRRCALDEVGYFDEDFFAHMEEIDLCWRFHLASYRVVSCPNAVIFHKSGGTLQPDSPFKIYLNHRNSLMMLLKNYGIGNLLWIFPLRVLLEVITIFYTITKRDLVRLRAILRSFFFIGWHFGGIIRKRRPVQAVRKVEDSEILNKMYRGSVAFQYFVKGRRRASELNRKG